MPTIRRSASPGSTLDERRGFRGSLNGFVTQALGGLWSARVDVNLVSDAAVVKDTVTDVAQQANQYLRSSAVVSRRTDDSLFTIEVTAQQDTNWGGFSVLDNDKWPYPLTGLDPHQDNSPFQDTNYPYAGQNRGQWLRGPATLQKLPDVRLSLPWRPLGEQLQLDAWPQRSPGWLPSMDTPATRGSMASTSCPIPPASRPSSPPAAATRARRRPVSCRSTSSPSTSTRSPRATASGSPASARPGMRLDLVPRLSATFALGDWLRIRPTIWIRQDAYLGEVTHNLDQRGYAVGDLLLSSEISRTFSNGLRHAIQPSFEYRAIPGQWGAVPGNTPTAANQPVENRFYDEVDGAVMKTPLSQGVAHLTQTLEPADGRGDAGAAPRRHRPGVRLHPGQRAIRFRGEPPRRLCPVLGWRSPSATTPSGTRRRSGRSSPGSTPRASGSTPGSIRSICRRSFLIATLALTS